MTKREKIAAKIRALRAKTVENGCTEAEAIAAAEMVAKLLADYNMTVDEAEMRASPFDQKSEAHEDAVGMRFLWKVAAAVAKLTGTTYWTSPSGSDPVKITFFGFAHEVEIAGYLTDICANAMRVEQDKILRGGTRAYTSRQRNKLYPFLDGMADRLAWRILAMIPPTPTGAGLVVVRNELIASAMALANIKIDEGRAGASYLGYDAYLEGQDAGARVPLNQGVTSERAAGQALLS